MSSWRRSGVPADDDNYRGDDRGEDGHDEGDDAHGTGYPVGLGHRSADPAGPGSGIIMASRLALSVMISCLLKVQSCMYSDVRSPIIKLAIVSPPMGCRSPAGRTCRWRLSWWTRASVRRLWRQLWFLRQPAGRNTRRRQNAMLATGSRWTLALRPGPKPSPGNATSRAFNATAAIAPDPFMSIDPFVGRS